MYPIPEINIWWSVCSLMLFVFVFQLPPSLKCFMVYHSSSGAVWCVQCKVLCCWLQKSMLPLWWSTMRFSFSRVLLKLYEDKSWYVVAWMALSLPTVNILIKNCFFLVAEMDNWPSQGIICGLPHFFPHILSCVLQHRLKSHFWGHTFNKNKVCAVSLKAFNVIVH